MLKEQFFKNCSLEVRQWVGDRKPGTLEEATQLADEYLENRVQSQTLTLPLSPTNHSCEADHTHALHASHVTVRALPDSKPIQILWACFICGCTTHLQATCPRRLPNLTPIRLPPAKSANIVSQGVTECQVQDAQETGPHIYRKQQVNIDASDLKEFRVSAVNLCAPKRWGNNCAPRRGHRGVLQTRLEHQTKPITPTPIHSNRHKVPNSPNCKVYIGNLGKHGHKTILEQAFGYYGPLRVWVARSPPGFTFVEFEHHRDAAEAVQELNKRTLCGRQVKVEFASKVAIRLLNLHANGSQHKEEYGLRETTMSPKDFTEPVGPSKCSRESPYKGDPRQCTYSGGGGEV
ncbi:hypothetical protein XELAEV_18004563mg [Xenopus laevis]|uniref:RRM domain-containing protein n=1 Tax=Xenopus laevis TaxID=8355 RepID=A0A974GZK4_XENLA|nr:hypothetical protein XELAEV_18004563mg [Xenopus laevis]